MYDNVAVQRECLDLQDRHGLDVNLLLFCAFVGAVHGAVLSQADVKQAEDEVRDWHAQVVHGLRKARHAVKSFSDAASPISFASFYSSVKERELEAERLEQMILERWCAHHLSACSKDRPSVAVGKNITTLFEVSLGMAHSLGLPKNLMSDALQYAARL